LAGPANRESWLHTGDSSPPVSARFPSGSDRTQEVAGSSPASSISKKGQLRQNFLVLTVSVSGGTDREELLSYTKGV
jgi:hypothetical protein